MKGTLVFVHGTGVRLSGYTSTLGMIEDGVRPRLPGVRVAGLDWGDKFGVPQDVGAALPPGMLSRDAGGAPPLTDAELVAARWMLLIDDPLFELRLAAQSAAAAQLAPATAAVSPKFSFDPQREQPVLQRLDQVRQAPPDTDGTGVSADELAAAIAWIRDTPELIASARGASGPEDPELADMIASAIVARLLAEHRYDEPGTAPAIALDGATRDALAQRVQNAIAPDVTRGLRHRGDGRPTRRADGSQHLSGTAWAVSSWSICCPGRSRPR